MKFQTVVLKPEASHSEAMRIFHAANPRPQILKARHQPKTKGQPAQWKIDFVGDKPDFRGLEDRTP